MRNLSIVILLLTSFVLGQYRDIPDVVTKVATAAGSFLKLEISARAIGMGGANVASCRGVSGILYNPSSIGFIQKREVYFSQVNYLAGIKHGVFTYGTRIGPSDFVWFHLFYLDSGAMKVTTELFPVGTGDDFILISFVAPSTYPRSLTDRMKIRGYVNYTRDQIAKRRKSSVPLMIGSYSITGTFGNI